MAQVRAQCRVVLEGMGEVLRRRSEAQNEYQQEQREHQKGTIAALPCIVLVPLSFPVLACGPTAAPVPGFTASPLWIRLGACRPA